MADTAMGPVILVTRSGATRISRRRHRPRSQPIEGTSRNR